MYELEIITKYNTNYLIIDDYLSPEVQKLLGQPYIISCHLKEIKDIKKIKSKRLIKGDNNEK